MQITIIPLGTGSPSVGDYIADIEYYLTQQGIDHALGDMGTVINGPVNDLLALAQELHNLPFSRGAQRVVTQIIIDDRRDRERKIGEKQEAVLNRIRERGEHEKKR